jgi:xylulokinase
MIYLGIDCGTQSTKTIALDGDTGKIIASASRAYDVLPGLPPGHLEQDPATWSNAVDETIQEIAGKLGERKKEIAGIGVSGQQHGFVPLDRERKVIRPAKLWCDTSTAKECDLIRQHFGGSKAVIEKVGMDMLPGFTAPKILWLKRHEPENFARLATVLLPHDYFNHYLTGNKYMEYGDASGTIYAYSHKPVVDPGGEVAGFCDSTDAWLPLVCTMNVTVATEAARRMFGWSHTQMEDAIRTVPAGADGLLFLPYLQGERTPNLPNGTGVFHGLTTRTMSPAHLARATMEGVTLGLAYGLQRMRTLGITPTEIRLTGGGSKSALWRQICADVFRCRVVTLAESEGAALGAAIQALACLETKKTVNQWSTDIAQVIPSEAAEPIAKPDFDYIAALEKQVSLTSALAERGLM